MLKIVGIITKNRALGSILAMILRDSENTRVRQFENIHALRVYLRVAPIDLLICDYQLNDISCAQLISGLKSNPRLHCENMQTIVLTRDIDRQLQQEIGIAGIDEVIVKPMSPQYVFERVQARLAMPARYRRVPAPRSSLRRGESQITRLHPDHLDASNVIPLFSTPAEQSRPELV